MRQYQEGDDLRRIHWPQRRADRRADDPPGRVVAARQRAPVRGHARERPSGGRTVRRSSGRCRCRHVGVLLARRVRVAARDRRHAPGRAHRGPVPGCAHRRDASRRAPSAPALSHLRALGVRPTRRSCASRRRPQPARAHLPDPQPASAFGPKLAVLVYPVDPATLPPGAAGAAGGTGDPGPARRSPAPGGTASSCPPVRALEGRWHVPRERRLASSA